MEIPGGIYAPYLHPWSTGKEVYPAYMRGAEASQGGWNAYMTGTGPLTGNHWEQSDNVLKYFVFENPKWDFRTFDYDKELEAERCFREAVDVAARQVDQRKHTFRRRQPALQRFIHAGNAL